MLRGLAAAVLAALPLTAPSPAYAAETLPLAQAVDALPHAVESRDGYTRSSFRHWNAGDDPADGCNTRVICTPGLDQYTTPLVHNDLNLPTHLRDVRHK
ncbi:hypothetical protein GCM10010129_79500 [Streptomyces fumigatiscleroticus]|nr:hypothetical protein GCM10010129_79500 [Streptomyces fumigatiscleroticus]